MPTTHLQVITVEGVVFSDDVDMVLAPGAEGQLGILPRHAYLLSALSEGVLVARKAGEEDQYIAIGGGFMEVGPDYVTVLADAAERAEQIDVARAQAARKRAEALLQRKLDRIEFAQAEAALRRAVSRLDAADRIKRRGRRPEISSGE